MSESRSTETRTDMPPPTLEGRAAKAWRLPLNPQTPDQAAGLAHWLVEHPSAHPYWTRWHVSLIHLRDIPGVPPAKKRSAEVTHEFIIYALNPDSYGEHPKAFTEAKFSFRYLTPVDVVEQFELPADSLAIHIAELAVRAICDGLASPDQDFRRWWGQTIQATAAHYRTGKHGVA